MVKINPKEQKLFRIYEGFIIIYFLLDSLKAN